MKHNPIADVFSAIKNAETIGRKECVIPASSLIKNILKIMQENRYIGKFELIEDGRGGKFKIELQGKINDCNAVNPNFSVKNTEFIKWEKRFLPGEKIGILIVTTPKGVMDQKTALKEGVGGRLLGYVY